MTNTLFLLQNYTPKFWMVRYGPRCGWGPEWGPGLPRYRLTAAGVKNADVGKHEDGAGLRLVKRDRDAGKWVFRFKRAGRAREMGLGPWPAVSLADARRAAAAARAVLAQGRDPIDQRERERRLEVRTDTSLGAMTRDCFESRKAELRGEGRAGRWLSPLEIHVLPKLGRMPVQEVDAQALRDVLAPIWHTKADTARKAANRLNLVLKHAAALGVVVDLQAVDKARALLGQSRHRTKNIPAMPWAEVPAFYQSLTDLTSVNLALRFLILTGQRSKPVRFLHFDQIAGDVWTVPGSLMKGREGKTEDFRVPLCAEALDVFEAAEPMARGGFLFPSARGDVVSDMAMGMHMRRKGLEARPHGFRTSLRTWLAEATSAPHEVAETMLAHKVDSAVTRAYRRTDFLEERRKLHDAWAVFLTREKALDGNVVSLEAG